jgi:hypothetical protein
MSLPFGVMKADVWRVAVLYVYGGVYVDIDCECIVPIQEWIENYSLVVSAETDGGELANFAFAAEPRHPALLSVLNKLMEIYDDGKVFDPDTISPVQDFGQYGFSKGVIEYLAGRDLKQDIVKVFSLEENRFTNGLTADSYIYHHVASQNWHEYDSWRLEQYNTISTKPTKFITTFSEVGYKVYGKTWIDTFIRNAGDDVCADIYVDFELTVNDPRIRIIKYNKAIAGHDRWIKEFNRSYKGAPYNKTMAIRFSYKSFVMMHAFANNKGRYVVWLDGDCVFKEDQTYTQLGYLLRDNVIAVQREHNGGDDHCESGFVLFDPDHADAGTFIQQFTDNYVIDAVIKMVSPYDGFIIYKSLDGIEYTDLNDGYGRHGIQSDPSCTFLHPELKKRFIHNIGPTGKATYDTWTQHCDDDMVFKMIAGNSETAQLDTAEVRRRLISIRASAAI